MPRFHTQDVATSPDLHAMRCACDGCDPARLPEERMREPALWIVTSGAFELRDRDGRHAIDPSRAALLPAGHPFTVRHPAGPDTCIAIRGPIVAALARDRLALVPIAPVHHARIAAEVAALRRGDGDPLALAEAIALLAHGDALPDIPPDARISRRDRDLAAALAHAIRLSAADTTAGSSGSRRELATSR